MGSTAAAACNFPDKFDIVTPSASSLLNHCCTRSNPASRLLPRQRTVSLAGRLPIKIRHLQAVQDWHTPC
jgi:hypothetical protein